MLTEGDAAPNFELKDQDGKEWRLKDLQGQKVILYFYPADDTPGCTKEACDFRDSHQYWQNAGYLVLGVSPQGIESKKAFAEKFSLNFPILADDDGSVSKAYSAVRDMPGDWKGIPLITSRSTFVIDENGKITQALYGVHAKNHVNELRESLSV
jgi:peroxiredoxin Q/BCP